MCLLWFITAAGATIIEANLSCPNVGKGQGALYSDAQQVRLVYCHMVPPQSRL